MILFPALYNSVGNNVFNMGRITRSDVIPKER